MKNPTYTGCIVYGRIPKSLYEGIKMHRAPKEEWRYVPDAHEPIISQELFDKVQKMFADRAEKQNNTAFTVFPKCCSLRNASNPFPAKQRFYTV